MRQRIDFRQIVASLLSAGWTTRSIAKAVGVTQPSISRLATGVTTALNAEAALRLIELAGGSVQMPTGAPAVPAQEVSDAA